MPQYGDPRLQALYNLGQTFGDIPRQYGQQRLQEAQIGLQEKKLGYDMEMQQAKYGLEAAKQQYELPVMKQKAAEAEQKLQQMETLKQTPVNLGAMFKQLNVTQDKHDWALKVTKNVLDALDLDLDDEGNVQRSTGEPLTQYDMAYGKEGKITGAILSSMTDKWRETEDLAKQYPDDPDIQEQWKAMQEKGKANVYEESYNEKIQGLGQLQSTFGIDQKIIKDLMTHADRDMTQADYYRKQEEPTTETEKLLKRIDELPQESPKKDILTARLEKLTQKTGEKIEIDATTGKVTITRGELSMDKVTPTVKTQLQKDILSLTEQLQEVKILGATAFKDALTLPGRVKAGVIRAKDYLSMEVTPENKEYLGKVRTFIEGIEQVFNKYRKEITGAQAAMKEIAMLRDSIINRKLTPTEFDYSYKRFVSQIERTLRLKRYFLRQGFSGNDLGKNIDSMFLSGSDVPNSEINARGEELQNQGLNEIEVINQLKKEGYSGD